MLRRPSVVVRSADTGVAGRTVHTLQAAENAPETGVPVTVFSAGVMPGGYSDKEYHLGLWRVSGLGAPPDLALGLVQGRVPLFAFGPVVEVSAAVKRVRAALPTTVAIELEMFRRDTSRPHTGVGHVLDRGLGVLLFSPGAAVSRAIANYVTYDAADLPALEPLLHPAVVGYLFGGVCPAPVVHQQLLLLDGAGHLAGILAACYPRCPAITLVCPLADADLRGQLQAGYRGATPRGLTQIHPDQRCSAAMRHRLATRMGASQPGAKPRRDGRGGTRHIAPHHHAHRRPTHHRA
jgi:hypothetical protein